MNSQKQAQILNFIADCNDFINGKYLFATNKLLNLYSDINQSADLSDLFTQCQQDFDYSLESTKAFTKLPTKPGVFTPPQELDKFLALIYGVLKDINNQDMEFNIFVSKFFSGNDKLPPNQNFAQEVVKPLRDTVAKYFELDEKNTLKFEKEEPAKEKPRPVEQEEEKPEEETSPVSKAPDINDVIDSIATLIQTMQYKIKQKTFRTELKFDALFIITEILNACNDKDIEKIYVLVIAFKYIASRIFFLRSDLKQLKEVFAKLEIL